MARNLILSTRTSNDIDSRVERVLRGLGHPQPPLRLDDVRELLKLDLAFYTSNDPGLAREAISRIRVAAVQIYNRPTLILDAVKKFSLKALYLPDRKRIMLDSAVPLLKHRWNEAHEIGHSLIPWHQDMMHGDNESTVSRQCAEQIEAEANYAAGRLLFLRDRFVVEARSSSPSLQSVIDLKNIYGNTLSTTLYRFVESVGDETPVVGLMSCHPHVDRRPADFDPVRPCRHLIQSAAFNARFSRISEVELFNAVSTYCGRQKGGLLGERELILTDDNGDSHRFFFETFFNRYDALTLGVYLGAEALMIPVSA